MKLITTLLIMVSLGWGQSAIVRSGQANTYSGGGLQDFTNVTLLPPNAASDPGTCTVGFIFYNTATGSFKVCTATNVLNTVLRNGVTVTVAQGGTGVATLTGVVKGNGTSAFTAAVSSDITGLWSGTCNSTSYLRGDGACSTVASFTGSLAGDVTGTQSATVVGRINGVALSGLATGVLKNTTTTGVPSIAVSADIIALWSGTCSSSTYLRGDGSCQTPGGGGTVTVVSSGSLTSTALVTGGGTTTLQTPAATATMDSSGNISTPGTVASGVGGSVAGGFQFGQGTANTPAANTVVLQAPTSVSTAYSLAWPSAAGTGFLLNTDTANVGAITFVGSTGTGNVARATSPTFTTPVLGTPTSVTLTNGTGLPISTGVSGLGTGIATWLATPSGANLATALTTSLPNTKGGTGGDSSAQTGFAQVASGTWSYAAITNANLPARERHFIITGSGTAGVLVDGDDQPTIWVNHSGGNMTITNVWCETDSGTALTMQLQKDDGSPVDMLSSNLSCTSTEATTSTFVSGENVIANGNRVDFAIVSAGGGAHWIAVHYTVTY